MNDIPKKVRAEDFRHFDEQGRLHTHPPIERPTSFVGKVIQGVKSAFVKEKLSMEERERQAQAELDVLDRFDTFLQRLQARKLELTATERRLAELCSVDHLPTLVNSIEQDFSTLWDRGGEWQLGLFIKAHQREILAEYSRQTVGAAERELAIFKENNLAVLRKHGAVPAT